MRQLLISDPYGSRLLYAMDKLETTTVNYDIPKRVDLIPELNSDEYVPHTVIINRIGYEGKDIYNKTYELISNIEDVKQITAKLDKSR